MQYEVQTVEDGQLPTGVQAVIVERASGDPLMILSGEAARAWRMAQQWADTFIPLPAPALLPPLPSAGRPRPICFEPGHALRAG